MSEASRSAFFAVFKEMLEPEIFEEASQDDVMDDDEEEEDE